MRIHLRRKVPAFCDPVTKHWYVPSQEGSFEIFLSAELFERKYTVFGTDGNVCFCSETLKASVLADGKYRVCDIDGNVNLYDLEDFSALFEVYDGSSPVEENLSLPNKSMKCMKRVSYKCVEISLDMIPQSADSLIHSWETDGVDSRCYLVMPPSSSFGKPTLMKESNFRELFIPVKDNDKTTFIERRLYQCRHRYPPQGTVASTVWGEWTVVGCGDIFSVSSLEEALEDKTYVFSPIDFHQRFEVIPNNSLNDVDGAGAFDAADAYVSTPCLLDAVVVSVSDEGREREDIAALAFRRKRLHRAQSAAGGSSFRLQRHPSDLHSYSNSLRARRQSLTKTPSFPALRRIGSAPRGPHIERVSPPDTDCDVSSIDDKDSDQTESVYSATSLFHLTDVYDQLQDTTLLHEGEENLTPHPAPPNPPRIITDASHMVEPSGRRAIVRHSFAWAGYLEKKGRRGMKSSWKKRWFQMDQSNLAAGFVYYECMPPGTKFYRADSGGWELTGVTDTSPSDSLLQVVPGNIYPLGAIPLLCCVVKTMMTASGEAILSLHQQVVAPFQGSTRSIIHQKSQNLKAPKSSPERASRSKRRSIVEGSRSGSFSPTRPFRASLKRRSSVSSGSIMSCSLSPPPSRDRITHAQADSSDEESTTADLDAILQMEDRPRTFYLNLDGNFGVRGGLEQLLTEGSMYVTLFVFHAACGFSTRAHKLTGQVAAQHREKVSVLVKNCVAYLLNAYGGKTGFIMEGFSSLQGKMSMGDQLQPRTPDRNDSNQSFLATLQESEHRAKLPKPPLHAAAKAMNSAVLSTLTGHGYTPKPMQRAQSSVSSFFSRVLHRARPADNGNQDESSLSGVDWKSVDVSLPDTTGNSPLHVLLKTVTSHRQGSATTHLPWTQEDDDEAIQCMKVLLESCNLVANAPNNDGRTPLHFTATLPSQYVSMLISAGACIVAEDAQGVTPFAEWASCGNDAALTHVLTTIDENPTAVHAVELNTVDGAEFDCTQALVDSRNWMDGSTAIYLAIRGGHQRALSVLIQRGRANVNVRDFNWNTPLIYCCKIFVERIVAAPVTAVEVSAVYHECVMMLLSAGADVNSRNIKGEHCLHILCRMEPIATSAQLVAAPTFRVLLNAGVDVTLSCYSGYQCVHHAAEKGNWRLLELLLEPLDSQGLGGGLWGEDGVVTVRVPPGSRRKIDPNARGADGNTALDYADRHLKRASAEENEDYSVTIELLLAHGAYRRVRNGVPVESNEHDIKFMSSENGSYMLKRASLRLIIERLTAYPPIFTPGSEDDSLCFFLQYDGFCTSSEVMALLNDRLYIAVTANPTVSPKEAVSMAIEGAAAVVNFFLQWVSVRPDLIAGGTTTGTGDMPAFTADLRCFALTLLGAMERYSFASSIYCRLDTTRANCHIANLNKLTNVTARSHDDVEFIIHIIRELFTTDEHCRSGSAGGDRLIYAQSPGEIHESSGGGVMISADEQALSRPSLSNTIPLVDPSGAMELGLMCNSTASGTYSALHTMVRNSILPVLVASDASAVLFACSPLSRLESMALSPKSIWGLSPAHMAQQLTLLMHCLLCYIPPKEFLSRNFKDPTITPEFHLMKETARRISFAFASEILIRQGVPERAHIVLSLIHTAECCYRVRNLEAAVIIVSCLEMTAIYRLKRTWEAVEEMAPGRWAALRTFVGTGGRNLDTKQQIMQSPCVPVMGTLLRHIVNISEEPLFVRAERSLTASHTKDRQTGLINFHRLRKLGKIIKSIHTATTALYPFQINSTVMDKLFPPTTGRGSIYTSEDGSTSSDKGGSATEQLSVGTVTSGSLFAYSSEDDCYSRSVQLESKQ